MSTNLLTAKIIAGIAATGSVSAGGYFAYKYDLAGIKSSFQTKENKDEDKTSLNSNTPNQQDSKTSDDSDAESSSNNLQPTENTVQETYLLSLLNGPTSDVTSNDDLYVGTDKNTKNYQCQLFSAPNTVDTSCELYSLSMNDEQQYFGDLKKINETNQPTKSKVVLREKTFYKLKVNKGAFTAGFDYGKTYINLQSKNDTQKILAKMTVLAKLDDLVITDKKLVLAKANSKITTSQKDFSNFSCKIGPNEQKDDVNCSVSRLSKTSVVNLNNISFTNTNSLEDLNEVMQNSYYIIDFFNEHTNNKITHEKLKESIVYSNSSNSTEKIDFEFTAYLSGIFDKNTKANNKIFVLKDLTGA